MRTHGATSGPRVLIAGVGNVFCGDDGFGVAVAERLAEVEMPAGVEVHDVGIRGVHLAYQLLDGYDLLVLADAVQRGGAPGTVYVIEHEQAAQAGAPAAPMDAHDLSPDALLALVPRLGGSIGRVVVVGCEPGDAGPGMGLSPAVESAVDHAVHTVTEIVADAEPDSTAVTSGTSGGGR